MKKAFTLILLILTNCAFSQFALNPGIDTSSVEHKEVLAFWKAYVESNPSKVTTDYLKYWNEEEKQLWNHPDLTLHSIGDQSIFSMGYKTVLSILPYQNEYFQIKTAFGWSDSTNHPYLLCITNHYVKKVGDEFKLHSAFSVNHNELKIIETPEFRIYSLKHTEIPEPELNRLSDFILKLRSDYQIEEKKKLKIIFGESSQDMYRILGFDFNLLSSTNNPSRGMSMAPNDLILLSGLSSMLHETTHIYLNHMFPNSPLLEGLATFYGGSMGKSLSEGLSFLNKYVSENPQVDLLKKLQEGNFYVNNEYNPIYILQGLLIKLAHNKKETAGIIELLSVNNYNDIFKSYFNIRNESFVDDFLRTELRKNSS